MIQGYVSIRGRETQWKALRHYSRIVLCGYPPQVPQHMYIQDDILSAESTYILER